MRFVDYDECGRGDQRLGRGAESLGADEVEFSIRFACGVAPSSAEAGGGDDERSHCTHARDSECDIGLAESGRVGEECPAVSVDALIEPMDGGDLVWQEGDLSKGDWSGAELQRACAERAARQLKNERVARCHDAGRDGVVR